MTCWERTAPSPISEASVCRRKDLVKSGWVKTGLLARHSFSIWKATLHLSDHWTFCASKFLVRSEREAASVVKSGMNWQ